jgi:hypothetical protein
MGDRIALPLLEVLEMMVVDRFIDLHVKLYSRLGT